jgi:hypothetical protein
MLFSSLLLVFMLSTFAAAAPVKDIERLAQLVPWVSGLTFKRCQIDQEVSEYC